MNYEERQAYARKQLPHAVEELRAFVLKEQARTDALMEAVETGEVCGSLGHRFHLPDPIIRQKIVKVGWQIEKRCIRCGEVRGAWSENDWKRGLTGRFDDEA